MAPMSGASYLPFSAFDRIVLSDAESGQTPNEHEELGDPVFLRHYLLPPQERLDRFAVDAFLSGKAGAENHRYARFSVRVLHCHNLGGDPGINEDCQTDSRVTTPCLEK